MIANPREYRMSEAPANMQGPNYQSAWAIGADAGWLDGHAAAQDRIEAGALAERERCAAILDQRRVDWEAMHHGDMGAFDGGYCSALTGAAAEIREGVKP